MTFREQLAALIYDTELKYRERTSENTDYRLLDELAERMAAAFEPIGSWSNTSYGVALFGESADPKRSPRVHGTAYRFLPPDE